MPILCQYKFISAQSLFNYPFLQALPGCIMQQKGCRPGKKLTKNLPLLVPMLHTVP